MLRKYDVGSYVYLDVLDEAPKDVTMDDTAQESPGAVLTQLFNVIGDETDKKMTFWYDR